MGVTQKTQTIVLYMYIRNLFVIFKMMNVNNATRASATGCSISSTNTKFDVMSMFFTYPDLKYQRMEAIKITTNDQ